MDEVMVFDDCGFVHFLCKSRIFTFCRSDNFYFDSGEIWVEGVIYEVKSEGSIVLLNRNIKCENS